LHPETHFGSGRVEMKEIYEKLNPDGLCNAARAA